ncbi:MAG: NADH-quinone oxidoreductase subunit J [Deltaproteobacteria bacterium]|nr:NADH-quinone oxidoreductase subunit J [Deltaproteobacteria bacterium]
MAEQIFFWIFGALALGAGIFVVAARNPIHSAVALVFCFFCLAGVFVVLQAHFLAAIQVMVYAGAIMVLFIFVIMLLNLSDEELGKTKWTITKWLGMAAACVVGVVAVWATQPRGDDEPAAPGGALRMVTERLPSVVAGEEMSIKLIAAGGAPPYTWSMVDASSMIGAGGRMTPDGQLKVTAVKKESKLDGLDSKLALHVTVTDAKGARAVRVFSVPIVHPSFGTTAKVGGLLFEKYAYPFEIVSLLLLVAIVGAVVMAKKRI